MSYDFQVNRVLPNKMQVTECENGYSQVLSVFTPPSSPGREQHEVGCTVFPSEVEPQNAALAYSIMNAIEFGPYENEWYHLFGPPFLSSNGANLVDSAILEKAAVDGKLRTSAFRSVCWRVYLDMLPKDLHNWSNVLTAERRRFGEIKQQANPDPRDSENKFDHPLSANKSSSWSQHFASRDLRRTITQDVDRSFPDVEYFREPTVRDMMIDILFCYTQATGSNYKQGMHEILAPVCFVLHSDAVAFERVCDKNAISVQLRTRLCDLLDPQHLEADSYLIFERIMIYMEEWYVTDDKPLQRTTSFNPSYYETRNADLLDQRAIPHNPGFKFVEDIHRQLLRHVNPQLYYHLKQLEIPPALFGLRWIRLLFGHEFPFADVLDIWDCVFAIGENFVFVRYLYVAILDHWSHLLLGSSFSDCVSLLMRFPAETNIRSLIQRALNLYNPSKYAAPMRVTTHKQYANKHQVGNYRGEPILDFIKKTGVFSGFSTKLHRKMSLDRLVRRRSLQDAPLFSRLGNNGRGVLQLKTTHLAEGLRSNFYVPLTTAIESASVGANSPNVIRNAYIAHTEAANDPIYVAYLNCVHALKSCNGHLEVLCEQLHSQKCDSSDKENFTVTQSTMNSEALSPISRLCLMKSELSRLERHLDEVVFYRGFTTARPVAGSQISHNCETQTITSMMTDEMLSTSTSGSTPTAQSRADSITSEAFIDREVSPVCKTRLGPPGSVIRMQLFRRRKLRTCKWRTKTTRGCLVPSEPKLSVPAPRQTCPQGSVTQERT